LDIAISILLISVGFVLLIKGADFLVNGASSLAKRFNASDIAIGLTVVAMGTSAPELVVNLISGAKGAHDVVFGNIIGSNIFNMFLILGISSVIYPITIQKNALWKEIPFSLGITVIFWVLVNDKMFFGAESNSASTMDGIILLILFVAFITYIFLNMTRGGSESALDGDDIVLYGSVKTTLLIVFGIAGLAFGGQMIVENAIEIAESFGVSERLIGLTILAAGTSLPELATTAVAAFHKKSDLAVGNIIGSNIFNLLLVLGATAVINSPLNFDSALNIDLYMVMLGTVMLFGFMFTLQKYKLGRAEGGIYLLGFIGYMIFLFQRM
jgi:cation:H+ antiporter